MEKWKIWISEGSNFTDCLAINTKGKILRTRVMKGDKNSGKNLRDEEIWVQTLRLITSDAINDGLPLVDIYPLSKLPGRLPRKEGLHSLLVVSNKPAGTFSSPGLKQQPVFIQQWNKDPSLFDHVIEVDEEENKSGDEQSVLSESMINSILRSVFQEKPDLIFIALNSRLLETTIANLLKAAGCRNVVMVDSSQ